MSGMKGVHQVRRQRPQSAYVGTRKQSFGGKNATTTTTTIKNKNKNKKIRPTTAKATSRRRKRKNGGGKGSSIQQVYTRMLKRQADLYRQCNSMEQQNKEFDERAHVARCSIIKLRKLNARHAANNFCNVKKFLSLPDSIFSF